MDEIKAFLKSSKSKESTNISKGLDVQLMGSRKLLPTDDFFDDISQYQQYLEERRNCNIIRLTCQVNTICTNVLFNSISEIVKDEGSNNVSMLNYGAGPTSLNGVVYNNKNLSFWSGCNSRYEKEDNYNGVPLTAITLDTTLKALCDNDSGITENGMFVSGVSHPTNAIRDTQLSNSKNGFIYHCGIDIFNNHLLRSKTFKCVNKGYGNNTFDSFNTIGDVLRHYNGKKVFEKIPIPFPEKVTKITVMHLYEYDELYSYKECVEKKLIDGFDGWVGFKNASKIKTYFDSEDSLEIERPLMYMNGGDFVDMYPDRTLYSFTPKFNPFRKRVEKNWNYCLTYPSSSYTPSSVTSDFNQIIDYELKSLKIACFDENTIADNGSKQYVFYCVSKHGLKEGDFINVYKSWNDTETNKRTSKKIIDSLKVNVVVDDFIFVTYNPGYQISKKWVEVNETDEVIHNRLVKNGKFYYIVNNMANIDDEAQQISFKKVVSDIECDYYVRIFSRMPNFKYASGDTHNEYEIYRKRGDKTLIETYQSPEYDFENHISKLAFAKNIYSDSIGQVVYTDDIDLSFIKDNLGRPLSSLYFTIVKNNMGYKEWYGYGCDAPSWNNKYKDLIKHENVEYSHCFGKVKCGMEVNDICFDLPINIRYLKYETNTGFNTKVINGNNRSYRADGLNFVIEDDEVWFNTDTNYYGDLCYFDNFNSAEVSIQPILHRFNTAQRESSYSASNNFFNKYIYDEIAKDDYDVDNSYEISGGVISDINKKDEGYFYTPHYEIPIRTFGSLNTITPDNLVIRDVRFSNGVFRIVSLQNHYLTIGDKVILYDKVNLKYYNGVTVSGSNDTNKVFACKLFGEDGEQVMRNIFVKDGRTRKFAEFKLMKMDNMNAPTYARMIKDGTCRVVWRDIINNGLDTTNETVEKYPYTNGALYINKGVNLYLKRQDPFNQTGLYYGGGPGGGTDGIPDILGNAMEYTEGDNYVEETKMEC